MKNISAESVENYGEGTVLYFIQENKLNKEQKCLSLCKMKTLEYRIYRKLREKLKNALAYIGNQ